MERLRRCIGGISLFSWRIYRAF